MDQKTTQNVAHLARLNLTQDELATVANKLSLILSHFEKISEVNTEGVEPLVTPTNIEQVFRVDKSEIHLTVEEITKNAPSKQGQLFKVPPVI